MSEITLTIVILVCGLGDQIVRGPYPAQGARELTEKAFFNFTAVCLK